MDEEAVSNAVWQWFYDRGMAANRPENRKMFLKALEAMLKKFKDSDDEDGEGGSLQQVLIAKNIPVVSVVRSTLDSTMDKDVDQFFENIMMFNLFDEVVIKPKKQIKEQSEEIDLSVLDIDDLKI